MGNMGLKLPGGWKKWAKWGAVALVVILMLGAFIRLVTWEDAYYREMEGSERHTVETASSQSTNVAREELIEEEPTEQEVYEYVVEPDHPRYLTIDALHIYDARIRAVGINSEGQLGTPANIFDVGWYESSSLPGGGKTLLIDGHNGGPHVHGVFKDLPDLPLGAYIEVERGDGWIFYYSVVENIEVSLDESDMYMATAMQSPEPGKESLTLISCTGDWSSERSTYLSRQFVRAVLVDKKAPATS